MRFIRTNPYLAPLLIAGIVFAANLANTQFAWIFNNDRIERQINQIGEIYLDGLAASIKSSVETGSFGDTDRRLRSAFFEQSGIKEQLLVVFDTNGINTNIAGKKALATEKVLNLDPGVHIIDYAAKTLATSRRIGEGKARVTALLDIDFVLQNYNYAQNATITMAAFVGIFAGLISAVLLWACQMLPSPISRRLVAAE